MRSAAPPAPLRLDEPQCVGCAICVDVCPEAALAMGADDLRPAWLAHRCTACAQCVEQCPTGALTLGLQQGAPAP